MPNQNPADVTGSNAFGRWDYGPWFFPPQDPTTFVPQGQPYPCTSAAYPGGAGIAFPPLICPGTPNPSGTPESFMDTPLVNGAAYPSLTVDPAAYRFHVLNAGNDRTLNLGLYVADPLSLAVTAGGSGYTAAPVVSFTGGAGGGTGAAATAVMSGGSVTGILLTNVGGGYVVPPAAAPNVTITGDGSGATATATVDPITGSILSITVTNIGTGYTYANVAIDPYPLPCVPSGSAPAPCGNATATASITPSGVVIGLIVTNPGSAPWTAAPTVVFTNAAGDTTGAGAAAIASINTEVKMVDAVPHTPTSTLKPCTQDNPTSGAQLVQGLLDATGNPLNGTGLPANCYPSAWPTDGRDGGVPDPLTAGPPIIEIGTEGGLLPAPVVIPSTPTNYEYQRRSITVLNIWTHGLLIGPAERADVVVDFSKFAGKTLILYNDAPAPVPAFDSRTDYYTGDPDQSISGGAPSTLPGYGPNTRTIMQIKVAATGAGNTVPFSLPAVQAALPGIFASTEQQIIVPEPGYPAGNGNATNPTYVRIQDTNMTGWLSVPVAGLTLTNGGSGYASAPSVNIQGGGGSGATASLTFTGAFVNFIQLTGGGAGYSSAPTVTFTRGAGDTTGTGAAATAFFSGGLGGVTINNAGAGYTARATVSFAGGGGTGATATTTMKVNAITVGSRGTGYNNPPLAPPLVTISAPPAGGTQATATATIAAGRVAAITVTNPGSGYTARPTVTIAPPPAGQTATATTTLAVDVVTVTVPGSGYTTAPTVTFSNPGGGGTRATGAAVLSGSVTGLLLTNGGSGYTAIPTVGFTGGGSPTTSASALATFLPGTVTSLTLTNGGTGYTSAPSVVFSGGGTPTTPASAVATPPVTQLLPKTIQELFTLDYGRMNATLGVEVPFTNFLTQTTIPYGYVDPPTELFKDGDTQIWKITHNGVDTHFIHFHLFNVQVINRVGWDGAIKPPDNNETSWKDTVRMNPLEDIIVALRPMKQTLPWSIPNSIRPLDVTQPIGSSLPMQFTNVDPTNQPATVTNDLTNFGWEYVWHCHILGHEENDMMRAMVLAVPAAAPSGPAPAPLTLRAVLQGNGNNQSVVLTWIDNANNETGFTIERATAPVTPASVWGTIATLPVAKGTGTTITYTDTTIARRTSYAYRVTANNLVGYDKTYALPAVGYPTIDAHNAALQSGAVTTNMPTAGPAPLFANSFEAGFTGWAGVAGNPQVTSQAAMGANGGANGMAAVIGVAGQAPNAVAQPAYVYDFTPSAEANYNARFYFDPTPIFVSAFPAHFSRRTIRAASTSIALSSVESTSSPRRPSTAPIQRPMQSTRCRSLEASRHRSRRSGVRGRGGQRRSCRSCSRSTMPPPSRAHRGAHRSRAPRRARRRPSTLWFNASGLKTGDGRSPRSPSPSLPPAPTPAPRHAPTPPGDDRFLP